MQRALGFALSESEDDLLRDLMVVSVEPAPNARRLLVTAASLDGPIDLVQTLAHLEAARGWLRCEVAASITRRKVPDLMFRCVEAM